MLLHNTFVAEEKVDQVQSPHPPRDALPTLIATFAAASGPYAMVRYSDGQIKHLTLNDRVFESRVTEITPEQITLQDGDTHQYITLKAR